MEVDAMCTLSAAHIDVYPRLWVSVHQCAVVVVAKAACLLESMYLVLVVKGERTVKTPWTIVGVELPGVLAAADQASVFGTLLRRFEAYLRLGLFGILGVV